MGGDVLSLLFFKPEYLKPKLFRRRRNSPLLKNSKKKEKRKEKKKTAESKAKSGTTRRSLRIYYNTNFLYTTLY
jgi:hypothetical protein